MKKSKHGALALLMGMAALLLGGCSAQLEERAAIDVSQIAIEPGADAPTQDAYASGEETVTLYFLGQEGAVLVPVARRITVEGGMSREEAALRALLSGPLEGERGAYWPQIVSASEELYERSGSVATVDLPARVRELPQEQIYAVRQAVTHTLTEFSGISYVNVLVGGREEGFDLGASMPVGALSRAGDLDVGAQYARLDELRQQNAAITRVATLYFPSQDGRLLLAEARSLALDEAAPIECMYMLLEELGKGSAGTLACAQMPAPLEYIMEMPDIVRTADGAYRAIELQLDEKLLDALEEQSLSLGVYLAALTDTLMGFVPGVEGLRVSVGGEQIVSLSESQTPDAQAIAFEQTLATRTDFARYVGAPCTLYAPDGEGGLRRVSRVIAQSRQNVPRERLLAQMRILQQAGLLPEELGEEDILAVSVREDDVLVNLSGAFAESLSVLGMQQERAAVYAMVNTLTEGNAQQSVRFFFDGEQRQTLSGALEMRGSLIRNPGMVVE